MYKYLLIIIPLLFISGFLFSADDDGYIIDESALIITHIEDRVKDMEVLKKDYKLQSIIQDMKKLVTVEYSSESDITALTKSLLQHLSKLEKQVKKLRFYNLDDELFVSINYLKTRLKSYNEKIVEKQIEEITKKDDIHEYDYSTDESKSLSKAKINDMLNNMDKDEFLVLLLEKVYELEAEIDNIKDQSGIQKSDTGDETNQELIDYIKDVEDKISMIDKDNIDAESKELIDEIKTQNTNLLDKITSLEKARKKDKELLNSPVSSRQLGRGFGFQIDVGTKGVLTNFSAGILFPKIGNVFAIGLLGSFHVAMPGTYLSDTYRAALASGILYIHIGTPLLASMLRVYIGNSFEFGSQFSLTMSNIFGDNFTFGFFGYGGIEFYVFKAIAFFLEIGGGLIYMFGDMTKDIIKSNNNTGTGIFLKFGSRFYIPMKKKMKK